MASTIYDVARVAGVSPKTVSNVLNGHRYVREATRHKVEQAMAELDYRPNSSARNLRLGRTGIVTMVVPQLTLPAHAAFTNQIIPAAEARGWSVLLEQTYGDRQREVQCLRGRLAQLTDGMIMAPISLGPHDVGPIDFPFVMLHPPVPDSPVDTVATDDTAASSMATRHLIEIGRTKIATIGCFPGETDGYRGARLTGHLAVLADEKLTQDPAGMFGAHSWDRESGAAAANALVDSGFEFNALRAFNDALALGAMRVLHDRGIRVPEDVAVIGFDDVEEAGHSLPTLSTISPGRDEAARISIDLIAEQLAAKTRRDPVTRTVGYTLRRRESTRV
ncbi:LacI family DNA-binding transcriptional regulator [Microlunatus sp. GCM10028923]|uniref:LacI family DNA-binding transcriptional regulator n=1 Tax=Microlunatus sp. GCM10028923 TaxID=3273400 RepID=UPI00361E9E8A